MLSLDEIKRFIDDDRASEKKKRAEVGQRYAEGDHDIKKCRFFYFNNDEKLVEDLYRANYKIAHPFFMELKEQLESYCTSFDENPIRAKEGVQGLQDLLDEYFDDDFWAEIAELIGGAYAKGFEYLYAYAVGDEDDQRTAFECADSMGVVEVRARDTDDKCAYYIYHYIDRVDKGKKTITRIQVWSDKEVSFYVRINNGKIELDPDEPVNPRPHVVIDKDGQKSGRGMGFIPFFRLDNNRKQISGLKPIKGLIDDYDVMMCGLSNNIADFDTPLHVVRGYEGNDLDKLQTNLKTKKVVGVDSEGGIDVQTVDIPYEARKVKADADEKNIYRFGMGLNTNGLKDTSATTNLAIQAAYALLEMKAAKMTTRVKGLLDRVLEIVLAEINEKHKKDYQRSDVEYNFERKALVNETENAQNEKVRAETEQIRVNTILNVAATVGDEQTLKAICEVMDWNFDELKGEFEKLKEEQNTADARAILEGVVTDDEQEAEADSGTISE